MVDTHLAAFVHSIASLSVVPYEVVDVCALVNRRQDHYEYLSILLEKKHLYH